MSSAHQMLLDEKDPLHCSDDKGSSHEPGNASGYANLDVDENTPHRFKNGLGALSWRDEVRNVVYYYHSNPLTFSCPFVLSQELCERLAYYGLTPTLKNFLKRVLDTTDSGASAYMGVFQGTMYITPIVSAAISDSLLGAFRTILCFSMLYLIGLGFLELATFESIAQPWMVHIGLLVFLCAGAGGIKSCVNVFGAQQFHPVLQQKGITSFFTLFYASINVGSVVGGFAVPQLAESVSYSVAYLIPLASFSIALFVFFLGSSRYVKQLPTGSPVIQCAKLLFEMVKRRSVAACRASNGGPFEDEFVTAAGALVRLMPLCALQIPFLVVYNQMQTAFLTQAEKMEHTIFGVDFAPELMQNIDPIAVILTSLTVEGILFPYLRKKKQLPSLLMRFFIGSLLGGLAMTCAYIVESSVMVSAVGSLSIWWQVPQFSFIAAGEVFLISSGYEAAFTYAPTELKTVSSACNLINFAIAGYVSGGLFVVCSGWMPDFHASDPNTVSSAHYDYYFLVLASACVAGCVLCFCMGPYFAKMKPYNSKKEVDDEEEEDEAQGRVEIVAEVQDVRSGDEGPSSSSRGSQGVRASSTRRSAKQAHPDRNAIEME